MTKLFLLSLCAGPLLLAPVARADAPSLAPPSVALMAHIEIYEPATKQTVDHAVFITSDSNEGGGEMEVEGPGSSTKIRVRLTTHGPQQSVWFEVTHSSNADRSHYVARGELVPPPPGKRVLVAHIPQPGSPLDVLLSLTPAK